MKHIWYNIHTDGGARGNPGQAGIGVVVESSQEENGARVQVAAIGKRIGITTNNVAEYKALSAALEWIIEQGRVDEVVRIDCYLDSALVVNQLNGVYRIKEKHLQDLAQVIQKQRTSIAAPVVFHAIRREQNKEADRLVNLALDDKIG